VLAGRGKTVYSTFETNKHVQEIIKVFSPTNTQLDSLKNNFKFVLKLTLKGPACFGTKHHPQGANYLSLGKVNLLK
jgi:hypothetical protein